MTASNMPADRRVRRTQQMITEAFLSLCKEKEYKDIIIRDITERANVNRSTFYAHYVDKEELLQKIVDEKLSVLSELSGNYTDAYRPDFDAPDPYFVALFEHLAAHEVFYRVMLGKMPSSFYTSKMLGVIRDSFYARISNIGKEQKLLIPLDILLDYTSYSAQGIIEKWLSQNMMYSPHYMALQLTRLSLLGVYSSMGLHGERNGA
ncbi:TetR/AcrR family transcriptional regulator [Paenibacillus pinihumi]|uniref:TetR/AcrR family transcriptional regulator n=1 Tax=Paenibacillus pinihumi TaxID=669462 RepID=UPI000401CE9F|nr:TetR/AcrR family transcriptional regulator [Paenibacillus pinihumi]